MRPTAAASARSTPANPPPRLAAAAAASAGFNRTATHNTWYAATGPPSTSSVYACQHGARASSMPAGAGTVWLTTCSADTGTAVSVKIRVSRSRTSAPERSPRSVSGTIASSTAYQLAQSAAEQALPVPPGTTGTEEHREDHQVRQEQHGGQHRHVPSPGGGHHDGDCGRGELDDDDLYHRHRAELASPVLGDELQAAWGVRSVGCRVRWRCDRRHVPPGWAKAATRVVSRSPYRRDAWGPTGGRALPGLRWRWSCRRGVNRSWPTGSLPAGSSPRCCLANRRPPTCPCGGSASPSSAASCSPPSSSPVWARTG